MQKVGALLQAKVPPWCTALSKHNKKSHMFSFGSGDDAVHQGVGILLFKKKQKTGGMLKRL
jgi:hypothetical protein